MFPVFSFSIAISLIGVRWCKHLLEGSSCVTSEMTGWRFQPLWKMFGRWAYYSQYIGKKTCSKAPTRWWMMDDESWWIPTALMELWPWPGDGQTKNPATPLHFADQRQGLCPSLIFTVSPNQPRSITVERSYAICIRAGLILTLLVSPWSSS